jgi:hypothetical protein
MKAIRVAIGACLASVLSLASTSETVGRPDEIRGELAKIRWALQPAQHRLYGQQLAVLLESSSSAPVLARLRWTPVVCNGNEISLDPVIEPRLIDLVGDLPKVYVLEPDTWRVALYPVGIPVLAGSLPAGVLDCSTELVIILSTRDGRSEMLEADAPIPTPVESSKKK